MKSRNRGLQEIHLAVLLFGAAGLFGKLVSLPPPLIVLGRVFFATAALTTIISASGHSFRLKSRNHIFPLALLGLILSVHWIAFFKSIQVSTVAVALLSFSTFPVFVTFIEPYLFGERMRIPDVAAAFITFIGVALVIPTLRIENNVTQGVVWGILSGFTFAVLSVLNRRYVRHYPGLVVAFYQDAAATVFLLPFLFLMDFRFQSKDMILLILLGVIFTAIAHSLFIGGMKHVRAQPASIIASLEPVYGIVFALILLGEVPGLRTIIGGSVILGATFYATVKSRHPYVVPPE